MTHKFNPAHAERLLSADRKTWNDPDKVLAHLDLRQGTVVADIGCGPGYFSLEAARRIAPAGVVYGVDVSEEMLAHLRERAAAEGLANVVGILAEEEDEYPVPTESCDAVLVANMYHEVDPASNFIGEVKRMLKPGGTCVVVDWKPEETPMGPPVTERLAPEDVNEEFDAAGFLVAGSCEIGPYHYGLKFTKGHRN
jgi:ubiquinone/menaquinone biosynthesis C-methylase UbiE